VRVLVTGATGFIGREVVAQLAGDELLAPSRAELDLDDAAAVERFVSARRPEAVLHLAWYARPADYLVSEENLGSLDATIRLARVALAHGCRRFVGAGTCLEYADLGRARREEDPTDPHSLYASCKLAAFGVVRALCAAAGASFAWGRVFHLHGPREAPGRLLPWIARELQRGAEVPLTDGTQLRDHLHVADVAGALVEVLRSGAAGAINVCSGQAVSLREVVATVAELVGRADLLRFGARPHRAGEVMVLTGDAGRLAALGFRPRFGLRDGLADALAGWRG
jgi:nucleoside-diphosphate-sugar epimerase